MRAVGGEAWGVEDGYEGEDDGFVSVCDPHLGRSREVLSLVRVAEFEVVGHSTN